MYLLAPIHSVKFLKNSEGRSRVMTMCHFWAQNTPICPEQIYLEQTIIVTFIYLLALFTEQN